MPRLHRRRYDYNNEPIYATETGGVWAGHEITAPWWGSFSA